MSRITVKPTLQNQISQTLDDFAKMGEQFLSFSTKQSRLVMTEAMKLLETAIPASSIKLFPKSCEIPERDCPPRCVCDISWTATNGEKIQSTIQVTNTGSQKRNFTFAATPFYGPGNPTAKIQVSPNQASLSPGQSATVTLNHTVTPQFIAGSQYKAEILITGAYEQCVRITLDVEPEQRGHCEVHQGDPPTRIRAHHWYDHFQCEKPCFPTKRPGIRSDE